MYIRPTRLQAIFDEEESSRRAMLALQPTCRTDAIPIRPLRRTEPLHAPPVLPENPYYSSCVPWSGELNVWMDTIRTVNILVDRFYRAKGVYPAEICLSEFRYIHRRRNDYLPLNGMPIPYWHYCMDEGKYEILVR